MQVKKYVLVLVAMSLGGCASIENLLKERREAKEQAYVLKEQAKISSAQEACKRFGFSEKTDAFSKCIQNEVNATKARETTTSCRQTVLGMDCTTE